MKNFTTLLSFIILLSGCTPTIDFDFSIPNVTPSKHKINAQLKSLSLSYPDPQNPQKDIPLKIRGGEKGESETFSIITPWGIALRDALKHSEFFEKEAPKKVELEVTILEIIAPTIALNFTTTVTAKYTLIDRGTDAILYSDTVKSEATVFLSYAFTATTRAVESINQAIRKNIATFILNLKNASPSLKF